jgi:hypothetical protein
VSQGAAISYASNVRVGSKKLCSCPVGCEARKQEALVLPDIRVENRKLCFGGCEPREQEALFLPDVRVDSRKLCSVGGKARKQETGAVSLWKVRLWVRKLCSCGK